MIGNMLLKLMTVILKILFIFVILLFALAAGCSSTFAGLKKESKKFQVNSQPVTALTFSPDGNQLVSGSEDGTIRFWNINTFDVLAEYKPHDSLIEYNGVSSDGKFIISNSGYEKIMQLWSTETGKLLMDFGQESAGHKFIALSSDGKLIATHESYYSFGNIFFWSVDEGKVIGQLEEYNWGTHGSGVMFTPDSKHFICLNNLLDKKVPGITVWEVESGKMVTSMDGYKGVISHPDSDTIATLSQTQKDILFFSIKKNKITRTFSIPECSQIRDYQFTEDGKYLLVNASFKHIETAFRHKVIVVDLDGLKPIHYFETNPEIDFIDRIIAYSSTSEIFTIALKSLEEGVSVKVISSFDGNVISTVENHQPMDKETLEKIPYPYFPRIPEVQVLGISPDAEFLVTFYKDKDLQQVRIWSTKSNKLINSIDAPASGYKISFIDSEKVILNPDDYFNNQKDFQILSLKTGNVIRSFVGVPDGIRELHFSADGKTLISTSGDNTIRVLDVLSGNVTQTITAVQLQIHHAVISPDGKTIVYIESSINDPEHDHWIFQPLSTYAQQMQLKVWSIESGNLVKTIQTYPYPITEIEMMPDGETVACFHTSPDVMKGSIRFWSIPTGERTKYFGGYLNTKSDIALSASGKYMASTSYHNHVRIWDLTENRLFTSYYETGHDLQIYFNFDETWVVSCDYDQITIISVKDKRLLDCFTLRSYYEGTSSYCISFALSPVENAFVVGSSNGFIEFGKIK